MSIAAEVRIAELERKVAALETLLTQLTQAKQQTLQLQKDKPRG